jgi:1-deoxy-D-xylulose-5-phosphate synthase
MPGGTGLLGLMKQYPERLFDVGIAEEHAVSMAGGLAKQGMVPVVALYSTFLQRAYDQILQDISMLGLHVVLAIDRAGLVGDDGETHHGVFDIGFLRQAPGMKILSPVSCAELKDMLKWSVSVQDGPVAIRYPRGGNRGYEASDWDCGSVKCHRSGEDLTIVTHGVISNHVIEAAEILAEEGIEVTILRLLQVFPLDFAALQPYFAVGKPVFVVEETAASAGIHELISSLISQYSPETKVHWSDLGDEYVPHGSLGELYRYCDLDSQSIVRKVKEILQNEN